MYLSLVLVLSLATAVFEFATAGNLAVIIPYGIVIPLTALIPRFVLKKALESKGMTGGEWLKKMEVMIFLVVLLNAPASLFFHGMGFQYDRFLHFAMGMLGAPFFLLLLLAFLRAIGRSISKKKALWLVLFVSFLGLFVWEGLQFSLDQIFATKLFSDAVQPMIVDFWEDIFFGFVGMLIGIVYSIRSYDKFFLSIFLGKDH